MEVSTWSIITVIISLIGLLGNIALMVTYKKKNLQIRFNVLMITLAGFDIFYLISDSTAQFTNFWLLMHLRGFGFSASILTTVCISFERYMVLCKNSELVEKVPIGVNVTLIVFFSILINSTKVGTYLFVTWTILLSITLLVFNVQLFKRLKVLKNTMALSHKTNASLKKSIFRAKISFCVTVLFIMCSFVSFAPMFYLAITGTNWKEKSWAQDDKLFNLSYFLYSINSSMNYYIYRFLRHREKSDIVDKTSEHEMKRMTVSKSSLSMANNETTVRMEPTSRIE